MLTLFVPGYEYYDEKTGTFGSTADTTLQLEHSLLALSEWEAKWNKPFLGTERKSAEQCIDYVRCMTVTPNVDPLVYNGLTAEHFEQVNRYIEAPMTATWFGKGEETRGRASVVTAEVLYYCMTALNIPFECEKWHLNRLLTLIKVCNEKNKIPTKGKGFTQADLDRRRALNEARRRQRHSHG